MNYYRLRKREPLIALGSHMGWVEGGWLGRLNFCIRVTSTWDGNRFEHPRLAEVVPNGFVTSYNMHSESSGKL